MSTTAEKTLSKKCVKAKPLGWFHERIENSSGNGTADLVLSRNNIDAWIELKCAALPKNEATNIDCSHIRIGQIQWHRKKRRANCDTWCLVQVGKGHKTKYFAFSSLYMSDLKTGQCVKWYKDHAYCWSSSLSAVLNSICHQVYCSARN